MKKSNFLALNLNDFFKGLIMVIITSIVTGIYELLTNGTVLTWDTIKPVLIAAVAAGLGYLIKNFLSNSQGEFAKTENSELVKFEKTQKSVARILIIGLIISGIGITTSAQGIWSQFGKKTNGAEVNLMKSIAGEKELEWFIKPAAQLTALNLNYDKTTRMFTASPFSAAGIGAGVQHYVVQDGKRVNNFGVNALLMVNGAPENDKAGFGVAATINALGFVNIGGGRDFTNQKWLLLLGGSWSF